MKNKSIICLIMALIMMLFSSCTAVPENVQQDVDDLRKAHEESEKISKELNYINVKDVYGTTPKTFEYKNDVLNIDAKVCVPQAEQMYKLILEPNNYYNLKDNASELFLDGGKCTVGKKMEVIENFAPDEARMYNGVELKKYGEKGLYGAVWGKNQVHVNRSGEVSVVNLEKYDSDEHFRTLNFCPEKDYFYNEIDDGFQYEVEFENGSCNAIDCWMQFQENIDIFKAKVPNFDVKPYLLEIYKIQDDVSRWAVSCYAAYEYKGVCFDATKLLTINENYPISRVGWTFSQDFHCTDDDCCLSLVDSFKVTDEIEKHDEILDLDSAVKILQTSLAKERFTDIKSVELVYSLYFYGQGGQNWAYYYETPPKFYAEPHWVFKETADENGFYKAHYVNAFSGDFYSYGDGGSVF